MKTLNWKLTKPLYAIAALGLVAGGLTSALAPSTGASSHREAPAISRDPQADGTDLYAFVSPDRPDTVTMIANYYPFQAPYGGPNFYRFGDDVLYRIYIDNDGDARPNLVYQFNFTTEVRNPNTFLYNTGPITSLDDPDWNVRQRYAVWKFDPYNQENTLQLMADRLWAPPANVGVKSTPNYDALANQAIYTLDRGVKVFAGQRDDPFYVDLGSFFDLATIRKLPGDQGGGVDGLAGLNVMTIALQVPISDLTRNGSMVTDPKDPNAVIGVWTQAMRRSTTINKGSGQAEYTGDWVPVSRLGMPLVNEVVIPLGQKDIFNSSAPAADGQFLQSVLDPETGKLLNLLYGLKVPPAPRDDLVAIFLTGIPGLNMPPGVVGSEQMRLNMAIKPSANPNRLGVVGGDLAGFPNGRRLGDDVTDVALKAVAGAVYPLFHPGYTPDPLAGRLGDGVDANDKAFMPTFPYVASPWPGIS